MANSKIVVREISNVSLYSTRAEQILNIGSRLAPLREGPESDHDYINIREEIGSPPINSISFSVTFIEMTPRAH